MSVGVFHDSGLRRSWLILTPHSGDGCLDLFLEAVDQLAARRYKRLFGLDLGNDGFLVSEGWEGNWVFQYFVRRDVALRSAACGPLAEIVNVAPQSK